MEPGTLNPDLPPPLDIPIRDQTIDLDQFLKLSGQVGSGGEAKALIQDGAVKVNGQPESRRRRTLHIGDTVEVEGGERFRVAARTA